MSILGDVVASLGMAVRVAQMQDDGTFRDEQAALAQATRATIMLRDAVARAARCSAARHPAGEQGRPVLQRRRGALLLRGHQGDQHPGSSGVRSPGSGRSSGGGPRRTEHGERVAQRTQPGDGGVVAGQRAQVGLDALGVEARPGVVGESSDQATTRSPTGPVPQASAAGREPGVRAVVGGGRRPRCDRSPPVRSVCRNRTGNSTVLVTAGRAERQQRRRVGDAGEPVVVDPVDQELRGSADQLVVGGAHGTVADVGAVTQHPGVEQVERRSTAGSGTVGHRGRGAPSRGPPRTPRAARRGRRCPRRRPGGGDDVVHPRGGAGRSPAAPGPGRRH